jgi:hypothetical protein
VNYAELIAKIQAHLQDDGVVQITTYLHSTLYDKRHMTYFRVGADGSPLVRAGKRWDDIRYCAIRFGKLVER